MVRFRLPFPIKTLSSGHGRTLAKRGLWVPVISELFCINIYFHTDYTVSAHDILIFEKLFCCVRYMFGQ